MPLSLLLPGEEKAPVGWGSELQANLEKAKLLANQIKALGVSQAGLLSEFDMSVPLEGMSQALWQSQ